jgi:hypothetical protein
MPRPDHRFASTDTRARAALSLPSLALLAAVASAAACTDGPATAPRLAAPPRARADVAPSPSSIDSLRVSSDSVPGGYSLTGRVVLHAPAPPGGATVVITSSNRGFAWVSPDSLVVVPAGATTASFTVRTGYVSSRMDITLSAAYLGQTRTTTFSLVPAPAPSIGVYPGTFSFGQQEIGTVSATRTVLVQNTGVYPIPLSLGTISVSGPFTQSNDCPASALLPGDYCRVWIAFAPTITGLQSGTLLIPNNSPNNPAAVSLSGLGFVPAPGISVAPTAISFPSVSLGLATSGRLVTIRSTGNTPLVVASVGLGGANPGDFSLSNDGCSGTAIAPGASCTVAVSFEPLRVGARTAAVTIVHNAAAGPALVSVSGTGLKSGGIIP